MSRTLLAGTLALVLGLVAGAVGMRVVMEGRTQEAMTDLDRVRDRNEDLRESLREAEDQTLALNKRLASLEDTLAAIRARESEEAPAREETEASQIADLDEVDWMAPLREALGDGRAAAPTDGDGPRDGRGDGAEPTEEQRREWRARREQMMDRWREGMNATFQRAMEQTDDPAAQDRIAAIQEYTDYNMDLMRQMREAETDEERQAIREELGRSMRETGQLMEEQRQAMLRDVAESQGITDPGKQEQFMREIRSTLQSPLYRMGPGGMGGGFGRGGFGRRGGPR